MMKSIGSLLLLFLLLGIKTYSQEPQPHERAMRSSNSKNQVEATRHIDALKEGTLIVRLPSRQNKLAALKLKGYKGQRKEFLEELKKDNKELVDAFMSHYKFSKCLFIYDKDSDKLLQGDFDRIFLNTTSLAIDEDIKIANKELFYVLETKLIYFETQNSSCTGFVIMDRFLNYLKDPFPYYLIRNEGFITEKSPVNMVEKFEEKLVEFHVLYGTNY